MPQKLVVLFIAPFLILALSCNLKDARTQGTKTEMINKQAPFYTHQVPAGHPRISKQYDSSKLEDFWPFIIYKDNSYMVAAEVGRDTILDTYQSLFEKYGGEASGDGFAALLKVALKKEAPDLLPHLDFDPESGGFYVFADSETSQREFAAFASKTFQDKKKLTEYLTGPDKEKALNYDPND